MEKSFILDGFQDEAIRFTRQNTSVIVSAPTGAGKTLIAEYVIEDCLKNNQGVVYTAPIKALSNQKFRNFSSKYPRDTGIVTGDVSINPGAAIVIMTTEIFRNSILVNPKKLENRKWVIFDEIHYLDDIERGSVWEESIMLLPKHMHMLALSATIPNIDDFIKWLESIHSFPVRAVIEKHRPVPLHFFFQCNNEIFTQLSKLKENKYLKNRYVKKYYKDERKTVLKHNRLSPLIHHLRSTHALPCIYFTFSRKRCEDLASEIYGLEFLNNQEQEKIKQVFLSLVEKFNINGDPYVDYLLPLIKKGIAYHHAGLLPTLKEIIERLFTTGLIKLIFTTETFALGINMPAKTVVFDSLSKYYGRYYRYLKTRDFYQMAGRSGRRGIDREGYVFLRLNPFKIDLYSLEKILYSDCEPIISQLNSSYATILNLYTLMGEELIRIYPLSFHHYQSNLFEQKQALDLLNRKINLLKHMNYIVEGTLSNKADLASKVYSFELQMGELFESGFLNHMDEETLFTIITALVYEPRKGEIKPRFSKKVKKLKKELTLFIKYIHKKERRFKIYPLSKKFYFHIAEAARAWYEGTNFYKLDKFCTIDEGEVVRYFRMTIQVLREMLASRTIDTQLKARLTRCIQTINRDVIDAEKQLRQEL